MRRARSVSEPFATAGLVRWKGTGCSYDAITLEAALSYLGLGAVPPTPSLGSMLSENRSAMELAPWTVLYPGIALAILVLCINMFGDAVRDYLDPRFLRTATNP